MLSAIFDIILSKENNCRIMSTNDIKSAYKLRSWKGTLDQLVKTTGVSLKDVCDYTGYTYNEDGVSFYLKLPRKRTSFIGIGMAFHQPLDVINSWITKYGGKKKLYVKDISEDLVWIYLINASYKDASGSINYFRRYEEFQSVAYAVFCERWDEIVRQHEDTSDVEISLGQAEYGPEYDGIKAFVAEHMDAFKTAYTKPRAYLDSYVDRIIETCRNNPDNKTIRSLNSMRGYLDDSMINFLSGSSETINVVDRKTGKRSINIKHIPKGRKKYVSLCLSLGMTCPDIDRFLQLMGYVPLDIMDKNEGRLISALVEWENNHPVQRAFKNKYFEGNTAIELEPSEEYKAVDEMLQLKSDLSDLYDI